MSNELTNIRYDVRTVSFTRPAHWWLATRTLLSGIVAPDQDADTQLLQGHEDIRWNVLAQILTEISACLREREYRTIDPRSGWITISITPVPEGLTEQEAAVLESWFDHGKAPRGDAWSTTVKDPDYRLWNVWRHVPAAVLPIRSDLLDHAVDVETERLAAAIRTAASKGLQQIPELVHTRSPLYIAQVAIATQVKARA